MTGSLDTRIKICSYAVKEKGSKMKLVNTIEGHNSSLSSVALSEDNSLLATGAWNGSLNVWKFPQLIDESIAESERNVIFSILLVFS